MKDILICLGITLLLILYVAHSCDREKNKKEGFEDISPDAYLDNQLTRKLDQTLTKLQGMTPYRDLNKNDILNLVKKEIEDPAYQVKQDQQNEEINKLKAELYNLDHNSDLQIKEVKKINSIRSLQNNQPLSVIPLNNNKHLIKLNDGCLAVDSQARPSIKPCNEKDQEQYFNLNLINDKDQYQRNLDILGTYHDSEKGYNFPFHQVKSVSSSNCLDNDDSMISVRPCTPSINQQWDISFNNHSC